VPHKTNGSAGREHRDGPLVQRRRHDRGAPETGGRDVVRAVRHARDPDDAAVEPAPLHRAVPPARDEGLPPDEVVTSDDGLWVVEANGKKRRLAPYGAASWSPFGRFVVATRDGTELVALEPDGAVRWTLPRRDVHSAVWGGTKADTRIAYIDRTGLRVVAGDGTGDRLLAPAEEGPLAWRPGGGHQLAYVSGSEVRVQQTDTGRVLWRANRGPVERVRALVWSDDGGRLLVLSTHALSVFDGAGRELVHVEPDGVGRYTDATFVPGTQRVVVLLNGTDVVLRDTGQTLFRGSGLAGVTPAPDGRWLLVTWPRADQWVFVGPGGRLRAVAGITEQFRSRSGFPRVEGWCCS
jgi:hypothetical protein